MSSESVDVVVVGAGLSGLTAALDLTEAGASVLVLEREDVPGGRVRTEELAGCPIELGAHFLSHRYATVMRLVRAAGLERRIRELSASYVTAVWRGGRPHHMDYGDPLSVAGYSALSLADRARLAAFALPLARTAPSARFFDLTTTASVDSLRPAALVGDDALRYLFTPASQAFCGYLPEEISLPFLTLGARFPLKRPLTIDGGLGQLGAELARRLPVRCAVHVDRVERGDGVVVSAREAGGELTVRARAAVIATTPRAALELWPDAPARERGFLEGADYTQYFLVYMRTRERAVPRAPGGRDLYMHVVPRDEGDGALSHVFYGGSSGAPDGGLVLAAAHHRAAASEDRDDVLEERLRTEAERVHPGLADQVTATRTVRWREKVPLFRPGRARELAGFRAALGPAPIQLAGDYLYGPLMEGAALSGAAAARRTLDWLDATPASARPLAYHSFADAS